MENENKILVRKQGEITVPLDIFDRIVASGKYITCSTIKRKHGNYYQVMVCKKTDGKLSFRESLGRYILNNPKGKHVDHVDRNPLNNSRSNLRLASVSENGRNRQRADGYKFKHVGISKKRGLFFAGIRIHGIRVSMSSFETEDDAALAYNFLAKMFHGSFANPNKLSSLPSKALAKIIADFDKK